MAPQPRVSIGYHNALDIAPCVLAGGVEVKNRISRILIECLQREHLVITDVNYISDNFGRSGHPRNLNESFISLNIHHIVKTVN